MTSKIKLANLRTSDTNLIRSLMSLDGSKNVRISDDTDIKRAKEFIVNQ